MPASKGRRERKYVEMDERDDAARPQEAETNLFKVLTFGYAPPLPAAADAYASESAPAVADVGCLMSGSHTSCPAGLTRADSCADTSTRCWRRVSRVRFCLRIYPRWLRTTAPTACDRCLAFARLVFSMIRILETDAVMLIKTELFCNAQESYVFISFKESFSRNRSARTASCSVLLPIVGD